MSAPSPVTYLYIVCTEFLLPRFDVYLYDLPVHSVHKMSPPPLPPPQLMFTFITYLYIVCTEYLPPLPFMSTIVTYLYIVSTELLPHFLDPLCDTLCWVLCVCLWGGGMTYLYIVSTELLPHFLDSLCDALCGIWQAFPENTHDWVIIDKFVEIWYLSYTVLFDLDTAIPFSQRKKHSLFYLIFFKSSKSKANT